MKIWWMTNSRVFFFNGATGLACKFGYHGFSLTFSQDRFSMYTYLELQRDTRRTLVRFLDCSNANGGLGSFIAASVHWQINFQCKCNRLIIQLYRHAMECALVWSHWVSRKRPFLMFQKIKMADLSELVWVYWCSGFNLIPMGWSALVWIRAGAIDVSVR